MPYCPSCGAEYVSEQLRCSDCDVELVDSLPGKADLDNDADVLELVKLASFATVAEADMIRELLEGNGIRTVVRGEQDPIGATTLAAPTTLLVERRALVRAREFYEDFFAGEETPNIEDEPAEER